MASMVQSDSRNVLVSICCITYNQEAYIRDALEGFVKQKTNFRYEVLIHDDASTDRTAEIIREYEEKYPDLIVRVAGYSAVFVNLDRSVQEELLSRTLYDEERCGL